MESAPSLAVLIVAYGAADKLEQCLRSVRRHLPELDIHVWDNSGSENEVRRLAEGHPDVQWYFSDQNVGFAAAVNRLAETVPTSDLLLLNPDAELLNPLPRTRTAIRDPKTAAAAPLTDESSQSDRGRFSRHAEAWDMAHREATFLSTLGHAAGLSDRLRGSALSTLYRHQPTDVSGYLTGACLLISRAAWTAVGPFNEDFFLYGEESEWQRRSRALGWKLTLADEVGVRHQAMGTVADSASGSRRSWDLLQASTALSLELTHGRRTADFYVAYYALVDAVRRATKRTRAEEPSDFLVTADGPEGAVRQSAATATALSKAGHSVTVISLGRVGTFLPRELPPSIRLVRGCWWWPSVTPQRLPRTLVTGCTARERALRQLYRLLPGRVCISQAEAVSLCKRAGADH